MTERYDLAIIGTGTAAMVAANRVRAAGWSVAVDDFRPFGGTCALRGCDPKKMMIGDAEAADHTRRMKGRGVEGAADLDWPRLMTFKRGFTGPVPDKREKAFTERGSTPFTGASVSPAATRWRSAVRRSRRATS
ncbi:pyridine nucleotide-disulfide oxidoreductase dimerization region [Stappia sp. 22II-S9-Z10]|nr:pyridine nucleotide-disulfide oxidoreductase dimerization region [Stappia sp. 22II-S9-Z10]